MKIFHSHINIMKISLSVIIGLYFSFLFMEKWTGTIPQIILIFFITSLITMVFCIRIENMGWHKFYINKYVHLFLVTFMVIIFCKDIIFFANNYEDSIVEIFVMNNKNISSNSSEVWINQIKINDTSIDLKEVELNDKWEIINECLVSTGGGYIKLPVDQMETVKLEFQKHAWSGIVKIINNKNTQEIDLFSPVYENTEVIINGKDNPINLKNFFVLIGSFCVINLILAHFACLFSTSESFSKIVLILIINMFSYIILKSHSIVFGINLTSEIYFVLHVLLCIGIFKFIQIAFKIKIVGLGVGVFFGLSQLVKTLFDYSNSKVLDINLQHLVYYYGICIFWGIIFTLFLTYNNQKRIINTNRIWKKRNIILLISIFYLLYWLTYFPAILTPDSITVLNQALGKTALSNYQPIIYTLLERPFVLLGQAMGDVKIGIAAFSLFQMLFFVYCIAKMIVWMQKKGVPNWFCTGLIIYSCLNPLMGMYTITLWKDIAFALIVLLLTMELFDIIASNGKYIQNKKKRVIFFILLCMTFLLRNNGILCIVFLLIGLAVCKIENKKVYLRIVLASMLLCIIITGPIYSLFNIGKPNFAESLSIPLQQIGYVVKHDGIIEEEDYDFLNKIIPVDKLKDDFTYASVDRIKFDEQFNNEFLNSNKFEFIKVWINILKNNFVSYIKAYVLSTNGFYIVDSLAMPWFEHSTFESVNPYAFNIINYILKIDSQKIIEKVMEYGLNNLLLRFLVAPGFISWVYFICIIVAIVKQKYRVIVAFLPIIGIWASIMLASPLACDFRYIYPMFLALPITIAFLIYDLGPNNE